MAYQLDTSGTVWLPSWDENGQVIAGGLAWFWHTLDPFMQGYVEALFADLRQGYAHVCDDANDTLLKGFSDLAPATLARIVEDCAKARVRFPGWGFRALQGRCFYEDRQSGFAEEAHRSWLIERFLPLTPYLADDGKVHLREAR